MATPLAFKRRKLRESPLLQPLARRSPPRLRHEPSVSPPRKPTPKLSQETRRRWMLEALEVCDATTVSLAWQQEMSESPQHRRGADTSIIDYPSLVSSDERAWDRLTQQATSPNQSSRPSPSQPPGHFPPCSSVPIYARGEEKRSPCKPPHRLPTSGNGTISALLSNELLAKLQNHLQDKIRGDKWQNEVRSRLARPLSATVFVNRDEQLRHPLAAAQYVPFGTTTDPIPLYPYSIEAHDWSARIGRMYRTHCYRQEILTNVRRLAVAIRFFRRVIVPWLIRAFRRRRRAVITIQRQCRRYLHWKRVVLRPFAVRFVAHITRLACARVRAHVVFTTKLRRLVQARRVREAHARERRRVVFRWVAKTRVSLFVHKVWCVRWFRSKRERNLARLREEISKLEASDADVRLEYSTIFGTAFGRKLLKKELATWRQSVKKRPVPETQAVATASQVLSDTVLRLRQCFAIFDLDGSGALDLDEFELMLAHLRATLTRNGTSVNDAKRTKLTTAQVRDLFESLDRNGDGSVTCNEFEAWWTAQRIETHDGSDVASGSASVSLLATGLDRLVLTGHGMLFWLLGKKQQLERKFVKKRLVKQAQDSAKRVLLANWQRDEATASPEDETRRCPQCGRRYACSEMWTTTSSTNAAARHPTSG